MLAGLAVVCAAATFGPWLQSGSSRRTSYEVIRAAEDLDVLHGWVQPAAAAAWYFVPLLAALVVLAAVLERTVLAAVLLAVTGLAVALLAAEAHTRSLFDRLGGVRRPDRRNRRGPRRGRSR